MSSVSLSIGKMELHHSLRPVYIFTKIFAHCQYKFDYQRRVYIPDLWAIVYSILFSLTTCLPFCFEHSFIDDFGNVMAYTYSFSFVLYFELIIVNVIIFMHLLNVKKTAGVFTKLEEIDEELAEIVGERIDSRPIFKFSIFVITFFVVDSIFRVIYEFKVFYNDALYYCVSTFWNAILCDIFKVEFCVIMYVPLRRFRLLNSLFQGLKMRGNGRVIVEKHVEYIETIHAIHNKLCSICLDINDIFGIPTLLLFTHAVSSAVIQFYYTFLMRVHFSWKVAAQVFAILHWTIFRLGSLVIIALLYHCILKQVANMKRTIHNLLHRTQDQSVKAALEIFALHEMNRNLEFTVCGLFSVDFRMIQMAFATIATYVVLLIQLKVVK
ncbi:uncharacterized protein [Leptinotarsa decemlineata]|uniref:uncharacterized protein n=1 Tax=Leptinotarsa decemlineata TaxID=7539 RepID=UPI003D307A0B